MPRGLPFGTLLLKGPQDHAIPAPSPCRHTLPLQSLAVVVALTDRAPKEVLGGVCPSLWMGGHRL